MKFFDYLNSRHPNIKFTFEKQNGGKLAFLDILISNESDNFCTSVFRKKTSIGLYTNFTSFTPFSYKIGLIKTLLHRAFEISSSWNFFDQEKRKIKNLLMKNLYPSYLIDKEIKTFLENKFTTKENTNIDHNNKSVSYYKLPYIGSYSNSTKKKIMSYVKHFAKTPILKLFFHHLNCRTYFPQKIVCQLLWSPLLCTNLLVQDVNPVTLGKPNAIYQQGSRNICKLIQNLTFFNTWMRILIAEIYVMTAAS